ncbi:MAG: hypothetical protein EAZ26_03745 [Runella slithyformis]|nr:MAG: hypothetical protein EAZ26_03745 [Runella slithyformis]
MKGTNQGTSTDNTGKYTLRLPSANATVVVSFIGYLKQEIAVGSRTVIDVALDVDTKALEEVVVVGYGTQKKVNMTGAVSTVDTKMLQNRPTSNVAQALQGTTPGLIVTRTSGQPGNEELNLQIRGVTTANGSVQPLIVLDGVTVPNSTLLTMNPNDIESMSVLKDAAAAAIYGAQAAGGVILITSKKGKSGKVTFDYIGQYGVDWTINVPKRLSLIDEATLVNLGNRAAGVGPEYSDIDLDNIRNNIPYIINPNDTNNYVYYNQEPLTDALLRDRSSMQTHNISARGGSDKFNFMVSAGAYHKQGIFKLGPDNNARYNLRINLKAQLTNNVSLEALTAYTNEQVNTSSAGANGTGLLYEVYRLRTRTPFFTPEGRYNGAGSAASAYAVLESGGYNKLSEGLLKGSEVRLNVDYFEDWAELDALATQTVYTGQIDEYFDFKAGHLEYRSLRFENQLLDTPNYQGNAVVNYTEAEVPYTRIIEHKHFEFGTQEKTVITHEYSQEWTPGTEPYYPVNDDKNDQVFRQYRHMSEQMPHVLFGGRLAEYRYYDMHQVVGSALAKVKKHFGE